MNPNAPTSASWSRRTWAGLIAGAFAAHLALILVLGERPVPPAAKPADFRIEQADALAPLAARLPEFDDPTLFALPSMRGFSGIGWMKLPGPRHEFHEWMEEQRWLPLRTAELGANFVQYVHALADTRPAPIQKMPPAVEVIPEAGQPEWLGARSTWKAAGALANRAVLHEPGPLPAWPQADVLARTEVQVLVDGPGRVLSAVVLGESGLAKADARALEAARTLQFAPQTNAAPVSASLYFFWSTTPTNAPATP